MDKTIAKKIKDARIKKGWSQTRLTMETGIAQNIISALENANIPLYPKYKDLLGKVLDIEI